MNTYDFRVGRVLGQGLRVLLQNLLPFLLLAALAYLPAGISLAHMPQPPPPDPAAGLWGELSAGQPTYQVWLEQLARALLTGAVAFATFSSLAGTRVGLLASLKSGARVLLPVLGVAILTGLGTGLGLLLIVPGLVLMCMWFVAVPVAAIEGAPTLSAMGRSIDLTRGYRWRILGVLCIWFVTMLVIGVLVFIIFPFGEWADLGGENGPVLLQTESDWRAEQFATLAITACFGLYIAVCAAVAYHDLRVVKEGASTPDLLSVFE